MLLKAYVKMRTLLINQKGQSLMEYALLAALIAVVLIGAVIGFRDKLVGIFHKITSELDRT